MLIYLFCVSSIKLKILSTFCGSLGGIENTFCHRTIATIGRYQQKGRHEI